MSSTDIVTFLRARFDEQERYALQLNGERWVAPAHRNGPTLATEGNPENPFADLRDSGRMMWARAAHATHNDPARVLDEIDAKRRIVTAYALALDIVEATDYPDMINVGEESGLKTAVRALAAVYRDHPDYRPEWAPEAEG